MPYFKDKEGSLHFLSEQDITNGGEALLSSDCQPITDDEATAQTSVIPDPKLAIQAQINALEFTSLMNRGIREWFLVTAVQQAESAGATEPQLYAGNTFYSRTKDLNTQITALRHQL